MNTQANTLAPFKAAVLAAQQAVDAWEIDADSDEVVGAFRDMLSDAYGTIKVCGMEMDAAHIYEECDPDAFRQDLINYVDGLARSDFDEFRELEEELESAEAALSDAEDALDEEEA